jgi:hypothetical protein
MNELPTEEQPTWLDSLVGMECYGIRIVDASLGTSTVECRGGGSTVIALVLSTEAEWAGFWYYDDLHEQWYWSSGEVNRATRNALENIIKPNFDRAD